MNTGRNDSRLELDAGGRGKSLTERARERKERKKVKIRNGQMKH